MLENDFSTEEALDDALWEGVQNVDWVARGAVQRVKNQGSCGSCWAFSAYAATESQKFVNTGVLGAHSEQQLTSCDRTNNGCRGGLMNRALTYAARNGICTEASYPYVSGGGSVPACRQSSCTMDSFRIAGFTTVSRTTSAL